MKQEAFEITLSKNVIPLIAKRKKDIPDKIKEIIAIELFREGRISSGKAAQILGIKRIQFISILSRLNIPYFSQDKEELRKEFSRA
jgi:predicted HTH domain antitoxin